MVKKSHAPAYDYFAKLVDGAGVDVMLVGDSASTSWQTSNHGQYPEHMIYHAQCVERAVDRALIVVDLPFGTCEETNKH